ncbi:MAG: exonuclease SbcCD subunit D [Planctomycetia bacterium]
MPPAPKPKPARPITFLHTADWQLGKPFASITDPAKRARVQQERFEALRRIGAVVRDRQARFVVAAGDLFDSPTPTHATISAALGAIAELGVPVFAIPGNHDHAGPDSLWEQPFFRRERERLAPNFHLLTAREPVRIRLDADEVILLPCPLLRRHEPDDPTAWIRDLEFDRLLDGDDDSKHLPRIVIAHGSTTAFTAGAGGQHDDDGAATGAISANTIAIDRLPLDEIDYVSLGDWHGFTAAGPKAWYAGTPEIDRFPKAGQEPGHVAIVTVSRGGQPTVAQVATGRFRWITHEAVLDATPDEKPAATPDAMLGAAGEANGAAQLDEWLTQATKPQAPGEPGFDGCLAEVHLTGTVSLAGRAELDRVLESWQARLLRLDVVDFVRIAPTLDEIHDLAHRPHDPIISRVAAELIERLDGGGTAGAESTHDLDVIRQAIFMLHALAHAERAQPQFNAAAIPHNTTPQTAIAGA